MKNTFTIAIVLIASIIYSQECDPFTASKEVVHGKLKHTILVGEDGILNPLHIKTGIGPEGDIDTRTYAPLVYSSNLWIGGLDPSANIKLAAGEYDMQDWTPGPLDIEGQTNSTQCSDWNRIWTVTIEDILAARDIFQNGDPCDQLPESILSWPARNNPNLPFLIQDQGYANFWDENANGMYDPCEGDLPIVIVPGCEGFNSLENLIRYIPSEFSFYVMNDNGAAHQVSNATAIQMEVHVTTFTLKAQEAEGIVFFKHKLINKAFEDIRNMYFGQWLDYDLGCSENDKLGSDENRQMLYAYNDSTEEGCGENSLGGQNISAGFTFLRGPRAPLIYAEGSNGQDTLIHPPLGSGDFDTLVDLRASNAMIPNDCIDASQPQNCNPQTSSDFYNLMRTRNFDGSFALDNNAISTSFMFTGNPADPNEWSLCTDQSIPETTGVLSMGNLLLQPGATNEIVSAIYYTDDVDNDCPDDASIKYKDCLAQSLYENCLYQKTAPPSPDIQVVYSDVGVDIDISNIPTNYRELETRANPDDIETKYYNFEGIKIYQVASKNFDMDELDNPELSVLVYQGDLVNDISDISNFKSDFEGGTQNWIEETKVTGANEGIATELSLDYDFIRDQPIDQVNELYYVALSYAYNNYQEFDPMGIVGNDGSIFASGQQYPYMESNCGLGVEESVISVSNTISPYESGLYDYIYSDNTINIFDVEDDLSLQLISIDGMLLDQWNVQKGNDFISENLGEQVASGLYLLHVTSDGNALSGSHKLVVVR